MYRRPRTNWDSDEVVSGRFFVLGELRNIFKTNCWTRVELGVFSRDSGIRGLPDSMAESEVEVAQSCMRPNSANDS